MNEAEGTHSLMYSTSLIRMTGFLAIASRNASRSVMASKKLILSIEKTLLPSPATSSLT